MKKRIAAWALTLALACTLLPMASAQTTPDLPGELEHYNGHTYLLVNEKVSWNFARTYCELAGGHLASITSLEENGFAMELFNQGGLSDYYIGGTDQDREGEWTWLGGDVWSYENWQDNRPDNSGGSQNVLRVVKSTGWKWDDIGGSDKYGFLCEWDSIISSLRPASGVTAEDLGGPFRFFDGHTYLRVAESVSPTFAEQCAWLMGGHLATITSAEEDAFLRKIANHGGADGYYVGGTDRDEEGEWTWMTGETWDYENWDDSEPNNSGGDEDYLDLHRSHNYRWNDYDTDNLCHFICEWDRILPNSDGATNAGGTPYDLWYHNGHTYVLFDESVNFDFAENACKIFQGHLATVSSAGEDAFLRQMASLGKSSRCYLGGTSRDQKGVWKWVTGETWNYENWSSGEPNGSGNYLYLWKDRSWQWDDSSGNFAFLCEWDKVITALPESGEADPSDLPSEITYYNDHTYMIVETAVSHDFAELYCKLAGGHLATITSREENAYLTQLAGDTKSSRFMFGATDQDHEGDWAWVNGETWSYENWIQGEPNNSGGNQNYAVMEKSKGWQWDDYYSSYACPFICEWDYKVTGGKVSNWAKDDIKKAEEEDLIPDKLINEDLTVSINREEFAAVCVKVYENLTATKALPAVVNPFTDTADTEVLKAYNVGITNGTSATTFSPGNRLSREEAATMLTRVFKRATMPGWTLAGDSAFPLTYTQPARFADDASISGWAKDSVYFMVANKIINGVGNNKFAPKNTTTEEEAAGYANATREQALAIAVRMVENLG